MSIILFLAIAAILVAGGFLGAFIWATKDGQYDDTYTPSVRMLFDNPVKAPDTASTKDE
ncbi:cytochrome oxidase maturation protein, cbb3-type [Emticicia oligotrophica DSM 17448]|uniref:Cytochrome oxidase maturation protein, cbb3-type n=1 Tax=Emticicia oligotrophica (strain DSM 17448 / CIP 109782 / MTCC 6937 / GPTSA100-15) TaxID=929562 RepID=A0ABM5MWS1_EMTOG|nr:cbb3-type cytochrome oxidase assembly protein CcoS [Emticicia oligotrophica]AFK01526.1 cytochrome oxidase maturation protein, cbb3-type [Emticicia oligotrophica DSM 17448]